MLDSNKISIVSPLLCKHHGFNIYKIRVYKSKTDLYVRNWKTEMEGFGRAATPVREQCDKQFSTGTCKHRGLSDL